MQYRTFISVDPTRDVFDTLVFFGALPGNARAVMWKRQWARVGWTGHGFNVTITTAFDKAIYTW